MTNWMDEVTYDEAKGPGGPRIVRAQAGTLPARGHIAPEDMYRSRKHGVMIPECPECAGPVLREERGGPVVRHTLACSMPPRPTISERRQAQRPGPRTWPRRAIIEA